MSGSNFGRGGGGGGMSNSGGGDGSFSLVTLKQTSDAPGSLAAKSIKNETSLRR